MSRARRMSTSPLDLRESAPMRRCCRSCGMLLTVVLLYRVQQHVRARQGADRQRHAARACAATRSENHIRSKAIWYYPKVDYDYSEVGVASWYGPGFHGRSTANGEQYDMNDLTAAHRTLPMPSIVRVTNLENGRSIKLRVNDRGPFVGDRIIDVSRRAAQLLGFHIDGTARVRVEIVADESKQLAAALGVPVDVGGAPARRPNSRHRVEVAAAYRRRCPTESAARAAGHCSRSRTDRPGRDGIRAGGRAAGNGRRKLS